MPSLHGPGVFMHVHVSRHRNHDYVPADDCLCFALIYLCMMVCMWLLSVDQCWNGLFVELWDCLYYWILSSSLCGVVDGSVKDDLEDALVLWLRVWGLKSESLYVVLLVVVLFLGLLYYCLYLLYGLWLCVRFDFVWFVNGWSLFVIWLGPM